jgi:hypothetical protein
VGEFVRKPRESCRAFHVDVPDGHSGRIAVTGKPGVEQRRHSTRGGNIFLPSAQAWVGRPAIFARLAMASTTIAATDVVLRGRHIPP